MIFPTFKIRFQFDQELLFIIICERKCDPGSETTSLMSWLCAAGLGFPEIPGCRGTGVPRSQSWPRNLGTWMLWLPRALKLLASCLSWLKLSQELANLGGPGSLDLRSWQSQDFLGHRSLWIHSVALCRTGSLEMSVLGHTGAWKWRWQILPGKQVSIATLYLNSFHETFLQQ